LPAATRPRWQDNPKFPFGPPAASSTFRFLPKKIPTDRPAASGKHTACAPNMGVRPKQMFAAGAIVRESSVGFCERAQPNLPTTQPEARGSPAARQPPAALFRTARGRLPMKWVSALVRWPLAEHETRLCALVSPSWPHPSPRRVVRAHETASGVFQRGVLSGLDAVQARELVLGPRNSCHARHVFTKRRSPL